MKKKPIILRILPWVLLAAVVGGLVYVGYLLWGRPEGEPLYTAEILRYEAEDDQPVVLDNGKLHLELDRATTQFVLTDAYGHEWKSNPFADPAASDEKIAGGENKNALASPLNVYYRLPKKAVDNVYDAYTYSISRSAYKIEKIDDTTAEVTYSVGDIAREFIVPDSVTKERFDELTDRVKATGVKKQQFTNKYTNKKSSATLDDLAAGNEEAIGFIRTYPQIAFQNIYTIKVEDNNNLQALHDLLMTTGYSEEEKNLDIILTRSTYQYSYHLYTPEEITAMQGGSAEEKDLAARILEKTPELTEKPGYILRRLGQVFTPAMIAELKTGNEEQAAFAEQLIAANPEIQNDSFTIVPAGEEETSAIYTVAELVDENSYTAGERMLESGIFEAAEKPVQVLFDVKVRYRLDGEDFVAEVPYNEMKFNSKNASLSYISVLPMFGAVGAQADGSYEDGYLLVPEGGGALIRFNNGETKFTGYYADVYGYDYGIKRTEFITESKASFPVFGILRNEQSFFCVVEGASAFVSIQADINGKTAGTERSSYNYANAKAKVLHVDQYNVSAKTAELQLMYEKMIPDTTLVQRYRFTDSGDYAKLAASYGDYMREHYPELKGKQASEDIPVSVELIGAIDKRVVTAGLPVQKVVPTTTFSQGQEILEKLSSAGIRNLNARYTGWLRGGVKQKVLTGVHVLNELGGEKGVKELIAKEKEAGVPLYFDGITAFAYDSGLIDGFVTARDAARHITREVAELVQFSPIYYTEDKERDSYYLVKPSYAKKNAGNLIDWLQKNGANGVTFRDIGVMLSADYDPNCVATREEVKTLNIQTLQEARSAGEKVMIKNGFDFTLPYADIVTDMNLGGNRYVLLDKYIPFYQIALHGLIDYTGEAMNLQGDYQTELLRSVEYGAGLNYAFTAEKASVTQETEYTGLYGTTFASWEEEAKAAILRYQEEAKGLNQQRITGHEILNEYVTVTTYEDGTKIYVNYGTEEYSGEAKVHARDYLIVGKEGK